MSLRFRCHGCQEAEVLIEFPEGGLVKDRGVGICEKCQTRIYVGIDYAEGADATAIQAQVDALKLAQKLQRRIELMEHRERTALAEKHRIENLDSKGTAIITHLRDSFVNDGAEGESVHALIQLYEAARRRIDIQEKTALNLHAGGMVSGFDIALSLIRMVDLRLNNPVIREACNLLSGSITEVKEKLEASIKAGTVEGLKVET